MRYSGSSRSDEGPWFTLGKLEVTTPTLILLIWCATVVLYAVQPISQSWMQAIALLPDHVGSLELWRIVTWPFSHADFGLWEVIGAAIFWYFGTEVEREVGRRSFALLMVATTLIIGVVATVVGLLIPRDGDYIAGLSLLGFTVIGLYIAENPMRPFFFGIPAWVVGAVYAAVALVQYLHDRDWLYFLTLVASAGFIALAARKAGLLTMYDAVPELSLPGRKRSSRGAAPKPTGGYSQPDPFAQPDRKPGRGIRKRKNDEPAEIVEMPQPRRRPPIVDTNVGDVSVDDIALDLLLDKIADGGMDSLTADERQALDDLRARRRSK